MSFGDPGSCSGLGAALCTTAARLLEHSVDLDASARQLLAAVASPLAEAGSRLQVHAQESAELAARASRLRVRAAAAGLHLDELRIREPAHVLGADERRARRELQDQADQVAARLGRSRAELVRCLRRAGEQLDHCMPGARAGPGAGIG